MYDQIYLKGRLLTFPSFLDLIFVVELATELLLVAMVLLISGRSPVKYSGNTIRSTLEVSSKLPRGIESCTPVEIDIKERGKKYNNTSPAYYVKLKGRTIIILHVSSSGGISSVLAIPEINDGNGR